MIKFYLLVVGCSLFGGGLCAQTYFSNLYDVQNGSADAAISIAAGKHEYSIFGGSIGPNSENLLSMVVIDRAGKQIAKKVYDFGNSVPRTGKAIALSDGNYLLWDTFQEYDTSSNLITWAMLLKFNQKGDTLWTRRWDKEPKEFSATTLIEVAPDSIILIAHEGTLPDIDPVLILTNSLGIERNRKTILTNPLEEVRHITMHKNRKLYARGWGNKTSSPSSYFDMVYCFDLKLNLHFSKHYPFNSGSLGGLVALESGQLAIFGDSTISLDGFNFPDTVIQNVFWIDEQGNLVKNKTFGPKLPGQRVLDGVELPNGNLLLYTLSDEITNNVPSLIELDSNHNPVRENRYIYGNPDHYTYHPWFFDKGIDGGYVIGGDIAPVAGSQDLWLLKVDSAQCSNAACQSLVYDKRTIGVSEQVSDQSVFSIYPNPTNHLLTVTWNMKDEQGAFELRITNLQGKMVLNQVVTEKTGKQSIAVDHLAAGLYLFQALKDGRAFHVEKLVIHD